MPYSTTPMHAISRAIVAANCRFKIYSGTTASHATAEGRADLKLAATKLIVEMTTVGQKKFWTMVAAQAGIESARAGSCSKTVAMRYALHIIPIQSISLAINCQQRMFFAVDVSKELIFMRFP